MKGSTEEQSCASATFLSTYHLFNFGRRLVVARIHFNTFLQIEMNQALGNKAIQII